MSRDTKAGYTDCQGHGTSPFPVAIRDELNEPERSVRPVSSFVSTICASDTDEGDYETSSEGMVLSRRNFGILGAQAKESLYVHFKGKTASLSKRPALDRNVSSIKREISDPPRELVENRLTRETTYVRDSLIVAAENLAQSKSLPILKNKIPDGISTDFTAADIALIPASSSARKRKMSTIIKKMESLISPYSSTNSLATDATINLRSQQFKMERFTWRNTLPILCVRL
ncbi:hypothetical protein PUN28_004114 [Cardiocondyla obscurior]|uniref:Uncharacterized protein n=1 Tax=Cardiocondyla obscurior TaxID=286306 RepID=A0AAW2GPN4_9HYME